MEEKKNEEVKRNPLNRHSSSGGGVLGKKSNELERFTKNKKKNGILVSSILGIIVLVGSILLYRSYALYKEERTFNVFRGKIPEFSKTDLELAMTLDGTSITTAPSKGAYDVNVICNNGATGYWDDGTWSVVVGNINEVKVKCSIAFVTKKSKSASSYIISQSENDASIEKFSHEATEQTPFITEYRYTGANPNNYVYFGCSDTCTEDNLYRIIGVIPTQSSENGEYENRVKLIKSNYYTENGSGLLLSTNASYPAKGGYGYQWNSSVNNQWQASTLQSQVLNGAYWSSLGEHQNFITSIVWNLGAPIYSNSTTYTPDQFYKEERSYTKGYSGGATYMTANIGLMYPSDYGYSIGSDYRDKSIYSSRNNYVTDAWLYQLESKYYEWTITPESSNDNVHVWRLGPVGRLYSNSAYDSARVWGIRPVFFLKSDVLMSSGSGTKDDPYRLQLSK